MLPILLSRFKVSVGLIFISLILPSTWLCAKPSIPVQLAEVYQDQNIQSYLVSEKYDGIRAIWKNQQLRTRQGKLIHAPHWFTQNLPNVWLDGELWFARNQFEYVASTVSKISPIDREWRNIKYMVFDAPDLHTNFAKRAVFYNKLIQELNIPHVQAVEQFTVNNNDKLMQLLEKYTQSGAEGLMLQKANALFTQGRNSNLLKLKAYMDAEAIVIAHLPGKGKYKGSMGALLVEYRILTDKPIRFKIGTGFSDNERRKPPPLNSIVTFKYHGFTQKGIPRFASFLRVREY